MEALEVFFLSIAIGLIVHLLVRWSERQKSRNANDASQQSSQTTGESALGSALGEVERELKERRFNYQMQLNWFHRASDKKAVQELESLVSCEVCY